MISKRKSKALGKVINSIKGAKALLILAGVIVSLLMASSLSPLWSHADPDVKNLPKQDKQVKKEKKNKWKKETIEDENVITQNAGTPHEFTVSKKKMKSEKTPDLSASAISGEMDGEIIHYIINLENRGNVKATDMDIYNEVDSRLGAPENFAISGCGKKVKNTSKQGVVELSNVTVKKQSTCQIKYDVTAKNQGVMTSQLYISPAAEGGEEIGPVEANQLTVRLSDDQSDEDPVDDTAETSGDAVEAQDSAPQEEELSPEEAEEVPIEEPIL